MTPGQGSDGDGPIKVNTVNLSLARRAAGFSQRDLADRAGISTAHVSRILAGINGVTPQVMSRILAAFGNRITFEELRAMQEAPPGEPNGAS
jgi:transcriptional regulator with XRE-family HTH domain